MDVDERLVAAVGAAVEEVAARVITPRFRMLLDAEVGEKAPGEVVTVVDREAEAALAERLLALRPGVPVVGEEAVADDAAVLDLLREPGPVWLLDPLDGTSGFVEGSRDHAVMVALVDAGTTLACWIHQPAHATTWTAVRGGGARRDGTPVRTPPAPRGAGALRGALKTRYLPAALRDDVRARAPALGPVGPGAGSAGVDHPAIAAGALDWAMWWRTLPWDHAPGALLVEEAGGMARRLDGSPYRADSDATGLLAAGSPALWAQVRARLLDGAVP